MHPFTTDQLKKLDLELRFVPFNDLVDEYLTTKRMTADQYEACTRAQKVVIQMLKRHIQRLDRNRP